MTRHSYERGSVALVMVLIVLGLITAIGIEIIYRSQVSASLVANHRDNGKAYELARAAIRWSYFRLQLDTMLDRVPVIPNTNYGGKKDDLGEVQWAMPLQYPFALVAPTEEGAEAPPPPAEDAGSFMTVLSDESSKINLNDVGSGGLAGNIIWSGASEVFENLLLSPRFQRFFSPERGRDHRELIWAIEDWIDSDSEVNHLGGGIEDAEYRVEDSPIHVKNGPFFSLQELRLLRPINDDLFTELKPFVTVYPFDAKIPRVSAQPVTEMGKININTAPLEVIAATFSREIISEWRDRLLCAQKVVAYRKNVVFRGIPKGTEPSLLGFLSQACGLEQSTPDSPAVFHPAVQRILAVRSDLFTVEATGYAGDDQGMTQKTIRAVVSRTDSNKPKLLYWKVL